MGSEIKSSVQIDFSKAEMRLQEMDRRQKAEDAKADILERRTQRLAERIRNADAESRRIESKLDSKLGSIAKRQAKTALGAFAFETLSHVTEGIPNEYLRGISQISADGLMSLAESGNPAVAVVSMMMKTVELLKSAQGKLADEVRNLRQDQDRRQRQFERDREEMFREREEKEFQRMVSHERMRTEVDKEQNELIRRTWLLMDGGN